MEGKMKRFAFSPIRNKEHWAVIYDSDDPLVKNNISYKKHQMYQCLPSCSSIYYDGKIFQTRLTLENSIKLEVSKRMKSKKDELWKT